MKKILYTEFQTIDEVIDGLKKSLNIKAQSQTELINKIWVKIVSGKLIKFTQPLKINDLKVLSIACQNAVVANELMLQKKALIKRFNSYSLDYNIEINDMFFSYKLWGKYNLHKEYNISL